MADDIVDAEGVVSKKDAPIMRRASDGVTVEVGEGGGSRETWETTTVSGLTERVDDGVGLAFGMRNACAML